MDRSVNAKGKMRSSEREEDAIAANERSPLLPHPSANPKLGHQRAKSSISHIPTIHNPRTVLYTMVALIFVIGLGFSMLVIPTTRIVEDILCHQYYDSISGQGHIGMWEKIDEELCKGDAIQEKLAFITGISDMMDAVPSIFCAIPYGILADQIGRRRVLSLGLVGATLSTMFTMMVLFWWHIFPIYLIFASPIFQIIGGGSAVLLAVIYAIIADVSTEEARAVNFLFCGVGSLSSKMVGTALAAPIMKLATPWLAMVIGITIVFLGSFVVLLLPETLHLRQQTKPIIPTPTSTTAETENNDEQNATILSKITSRIYHMIKQVKEASSVLKSISIVLLLLSFFTHNFALAAERFSAVYVSKRFHWHLSDTSYLMTLIAFTNLLLLLLLLPTISHLLTSPTSPVTYRLPTAKKDLLLARISILLTTLGTLLITGPTIPFVITGLVTWTLGNGFTSLIRSVITTMVDQQHVARLYSLVTMVDTLGAVVAGPCLPWLFRLGLALRGRSVAGGDVWLGLPFLGTALVCGGVAVAVWCVRLPGEKGDGEVVGEDGRGVDVNV